MAAVVTNSGSLVLSRRAGKVGAAPSLAGTLRLFSTEVDVNAVSVPSDFVECTFSGYSRRLITEDSWTPFSLDGAVAVGPNTGNPFTWNPGSSESVWGWLYVLDSGELLAGELFPDVHDLSPGIPFELALSLTGQPV